MKARHKPRIYSVSRAIVEKRLLFDLEGSRRTTLRSSVRECAIDFRSFRPRAMPLDLGLARDAGGADALGFSQACAELGACRRISEENAATLSERGNATKPRPLLFITRRALRQGRYRQLARFCRDAGARPLEFGREPERLGGGGLRHGRAPGGDGGHGDPVAGRGDHECRRLPPSSSLPDHPGADADGVARPARAREEVRVTARTTAPRASGAATPRRCCTSADGAR